MSQNMMVSWRRSAAGPVAVVGAGHCVEDGAEVPPATTLAPHSEQKLSSGGTACPQRGQTRGRAVPHLPQNFLPSGTSTLQPGHCKKPAPPAYFGQYRLNWLGLTIRPRHNVRFRAVPPRGTFI